MRCYAAATVNPSAFHRNVMPPPGNIAGHRRVGDAFGAVLEMAMKTAIALWPLTMLASVPAYRQVDAIRLPKEPATDVASVLHRSSRRDAGAPDISRRRRGNINRRPQSSLFRAHRARWWCSTSRGWRRPATERTRSCGERLFDDRHQLLEREWLGQKARTARWSADSSRRLLRHSPRQK